MYNQGWWQLKEENPGPYCGDDWKNECDETYRSDLEDLSDAMFQGSAQVVWRSTTCCGEGDGDPGDWYDSIIDQNDAAQDFFDGSSVTYVEAFLWDVDDLPDVTFDVYHSAEIKCSDSRVVRSKLIILLVETKKKFLI